MSSLLRVLYLANTLSLPLSIGSYGAWFTNTDLPPATFMEGMHAVAHTFVDETLPYHASHDCDARVILAKLAAEALCRKATSTKSSSQFHSG